MSYLLSNFRRKDVSFLKKNRYEYYQLMSLYFCRYLFNVSFELDMFTRVIIY